MTFGQLAPMLGLPEDVLNKMTLALDALDEAK